MSQYEKATIVTMTAGGDLRNERGALLRVDNTGRVQLATAAAGAVGVLAMNPDGSSTQRSGAVGTAETGTGTTGNVVPVALIGCGGILTVRAGAAITAGQLIVVDATAGRAAGVAAFTNLTGNQMGVGFALEAAADGEFFRMLAQPLFKSA